MVPPVCCTQALTEPSLRAGLRPAPPITDHAPLARRTHPYLRPPRRAPYLAIAAARRAHWSRASGVGGGPGWPGRGRKVAAARRGRGEGGADPDVHSWAPGEVEAPGPAAGGRATDAGTGTAAAAATMVKGPLPSRPHPGTPCGNSPPPLFADSPAWGGWGPRVGEGRGPRP